jgi:YggT family protein
MSLVLAIGRNDVADYVNALIIVYIGLIFVNILISYVPRMPYRPWLRSVLDFVTDSTNPYLGIFRRFMPRFGSGGMAFDLSPMVGVIVLILLDGLLVKLIEG